MTTALTAHKIQQIKTAMETARLRGDWPLFDVLKARLTELESK